MPTNISNIEISGVTYPLYDSRFGTSTTPTVPDPTPMTWYGTSSTTASTAEKAVACYNYVLKAGAIIGVLFSTANTAALPTLNINSTGAKGIFIGSNVALNSTSNVLKWSANTMVYFMYDGSYYRYITSVSAGSVAPSRGANTWYGTSNTTASTQAKVSTIDNYVLTKGSLISIYFSTANTYTSAKITLNINSTGAKDVYYNGTVTSSTNTCTWPANTVITFIYDGTGYQVAAMSNYDNKYSAVGHTHDYSKVSVTSALTTGITTGTITVDGTTTTFYDASSVVALPVSYSDWTWNTSNSDEANIAGLLQTAYNLYGSNNYYKTARELHIFNGTGGDWAIQLIVRFPNSWTFSKLSTASAAWPDGAFGVPNLSGQVYILRSYSNDADDRYLLFSTSETGTGEVGYKIIDLTNPGSSITATSALTTGITTGTITVDGVTTTFYDASSIVSLPVTYNQWHWNTSDSDETNIIGLITAAYNLYGSNDYYKNASEVHIFNGSDLTNGAYICVRFPRGWHFSDWDSRDVYGNYGDPNLSGEVFFNGANGQADERHLIFTTYEGPVTDPDIIKYVITDLTNPEYVQQNAVTTIATTLPVMLGYSGVTTAVTNTLNKTDSLKYNPSTKLLQAGALGVTSGIGYTTTLPTTTAGFENGQIMFVVFDET